MIMQFMQWLLGSAMQWIVGFISLAMLACLAVGLSWLTLLGWTYINRTMKRKKRHVRRRYNA